MTGVLSAISWIIENWSTIVTVISSVSTIALFFLHGNTKAELQELRDFVNSIHLSQDPQTAKQNAELKNPKI